MQLWIANAIDFTFNFSWIKDGIERDSLIFGLNVTTNPQELIGDFIILIGLNSEEVGDVKLTQIRI